VTGGCTDGQANEKCRGPTQFLSSGAGTTGGLGAGRLIGRAACSVTHARSTQSKKSTMKRGKFKWRTSSTKSWGIIADARCTR